MAKNSRKLQKEFEQKITTLEQGLSNKKRFDQYMNTKSELLKFYEKIADGVKIRSKCDWHQYGEKSTKFFLNLEKKRAIGGTVKKFC